MAREYFELHLRIPKPWRWLRLRTSTLFLLVAIVALSLGWYRDRARLQHELYMARIPGPNWGAEQAVGPPDTPVAGDIRTAWASRSPDDQPEWLLLEYDKSVEPIAVVVHESYKPGAVSKATSLDSNDIERTLWEGQDPTPRSADRGTSRLPASEHTATDRIKIYIDSPAVPGWNEIDAVGLVYRAASGAEETLWASKATASSSYDQRNSRPAPTFGGITFTY